jgi:predicted dienelactone hydrolase
MPVPDRKASLFVVAFLFSILVAPPPARAVGFTRTSITVAAGAPIEIGIWYPSRAPTAKAPLELFEEEVATDGPIDAQGPGRLLPLIVISHGTGGALSSHYDTALALARAGFVVAALTHSGDNYRDTSRVMAIWDRPRQVSLVLDYMLDEWSAHLSIDPERIGVFGFSAGGFTALALIGGIPDLGKIEPHCQSFPEEWTCQLIAKSPAPSPSLAMPANLEMMDTRIKAAVIAAPALGYTFAPAGLARVQVPVQLWRGSADHILPDPWYAEAVRLALPAAPEYHVAEGADHFDFLAPCSAALAHVAPQICNDPGGFDRAAFHRDFNVDVVRFFRMHLPGSQD